MNDFSKIDETEIGHLATITPEELNESCPECGNPDCGGCCNEDDCPDGNCYCDEPDDSMDGDFDSAMTSAGFGTDEDYCHDTPLSDEYGGE